MSRAMELLRSTWPGLEKSDVNVFVAWANAKLLPNMDYFVDKLSAYPRTGSFDKRQLMYGEALPAACSSPTLGGRAC